MNKETQKRVKAVFENHEDAKMVYVTDDGQVFLENAHNSALFHAKQKGGNKPLKVREVSRADVMKAELTKPTETKGTKNEGSKNTEETKNEGSKNTEETKKGVSEEKVPAKKAPAKQTNKTVSKPKK